MTHLYFKNGYLKMRSEQTINAPALDHVEMVLSVEEQEQLNQNCPCILVKGKLEFGEPTVLDSGELEARQTLVEDLRESVERLPEGQITKDDFLKILSMLIP